MAGVDAVGVPLARLGVWGKAGEPDQENSPIFC